MRCFSQGLPDPLAEAMAVVVAAVALVAQVQCMLPC